MRMLKLIHKYVISYDILGEGRGSDRRRFRSMLVNDLGAEAVLRSQYVVETSDKAEDILAFLMASRYTQDQDRLLVNAADANDMAQHNLKNSL